MRIRLFAVVMCCTVMFGPGLPSAHAQWVVVDPTNLVQNIIKVMGQVTQIANEGTQIANQVNQINHQIQQLQRLAGGDYGVIAGFAAQQNADLANLLASTSTLKYSLANMQAEIDAAYPQGSAQWGAIPSLDLAAVSARRAQWDALITQAGSTAARAQTSLNRIQDRNTTLQNLMASANTEGGDVRQAQISNQINGTVAQGVNELIAVQTTANRLSMIEAQTTVAERELAREQNRRNSEGLLNMGPAANRLSTLPAIR